MKKPLPHTTESREGAQGCTFSSATKEPQNTTSSQALAQQGAVG